MAEVIQVKRKSFWSWKLLSMELNGWTGASHARSQLRCFGMIVAALWFSMLAFLAQAQPAYSGFVSIDCGASASSYDATLNMTWSTDAGYTTDGVNSVDESAEKGLVFNPVHALSTLRRFPGDRNKSCYALPTTQNSTYLIRASFIPQDPPPKFDLVLEVTRIKTVDTKNGDVVEMVLKAARDNVYVCLLRATPSDEAYISTLELRPLDPGMYSVVDKGYYLSQIDRRNFGADKNSFVRFPEDPFDRLWVGDAQPGQPVNTTHAISPGNAANKPPMVVMNTAKLLTGSQYLLWLSNVEYYIVLYFAEIEEVNVTKRLFDITLDNVPWMVDFNIMGALPNGAGLFTTLEVDKSYSSVAAIGNFTFSPCVDSSAPPLLNAYEAYRVYTDVPARAFWPDAIAIEDIKQRYNLTSWSGDPCLPSPYEWLTCTSDPSGPRISTLKLSAMNLSGPIAPSIGNLTALTNLWLDCNILSGPIPDLSQLGSLTHLYLQQNSLSGVIPQWLVMLPSLQELFLQDNHLGGSLPNLGDKRLIMNITDNPQLCEGLSACGVIINMPFGHPKFHLLSVIAGVLSAALALVFVVYLLHRRLRKCCKSYAKSGKTMDKQHSFQIHTQAFNPREMRSASRNFSKKIGEGGFGPVFYGKLGNGQEVAIKVSGKISKQGHLEFFNEVDLLSRIHHKNLVSLIGYCQDRDQQMLIYEYLPNGSLRDHLYGPLATTPMTWSTRLHIALDAAQGLEYLHMACCPNIIHRDVKSSNILLTGRMEAKVSDFGLSKLALQEGATHISTLVKGTAGYLDPEYYISQKLTVKSDVYSFGVVLLELICGRPPINISLANPSQKLSITEVVRPHLQAGNLHEIVDPGLQSDFSLEGMWKVIEVAMTSVEPKDSHRPNMQEVVQELREAVLIEEQRCAKLGPRHGKEGRTSSASEIRGDLFTDTSQESVGSRYSMPSPR